MMLKTSLIVVAVLVVFLLGRTNCFGQHLSPDESDIYRIVLTRIYKENRRTYTSSRFVFLEHTTINEQSALAFSGEYRLLTKHFIRLNKRPRKLELPIPSSWYHTVSTAEIDNLLEAGRRLNDEERIKNAAREHKITPLCGHLWIPFHRRFDDAAGYYTISRVAFSNDRKTAMLLITMETNCSSSEEFSIYRKKGQTWHLLNQTISESIA